MTGKPAARGTPDVAVERGDIPRSPEQLEAEALADVRGLERTMQARLDAAFPSKSDPVRLYSEGIVAAGVAYVRAIAKATAAGTSRIEGLLAGARQAAEIQSKAAEAQAQLTTAKAEADRAAARADVIAVVKAGQHELIATGRRASYGWAAGIGGLGLVAAFGLGMLTEYWRARASGVGDVADKLAELRAESVNATLSLAAEQAGLREAGNGMKQAVADAGAGLSVLRTLGNLPEGERAAMNGILDALAGAVSGTKPNPQLAAVRELMALPPAARLQAAEFAKMGDVQFRAAFLPVVRMAEARSKSAPPDTGEGVYPGCVANGPAVPLRGGTSLRTCLVQVPDDWKQPDTYLRRLYTGR